ncbi:ABC transporter ATP-binding protein [Streptomyces sp. 7N604]|uniref:ABC transporter ATP-binding protein n=1 Tax=Streptomyces sp. 7N604 TaxID=3457415 RepID=UPI003FD2C117
MSLCLSSCTYAYRRWRQPVLDHLDYRLPEGLTILLGPNGAGKSTLLKLAASVNRPQSGTIAFKDIPSSARAYRQQVAWMPQTITAMPSLTAREYVAYCGWLKGMNRSDAWQRAATALARVELADRAGMKTTQLSGGQLRRVGVAAAIVHDARVLLLDEPTAGMDPRQRRVFYDQIRGLVDEVSVMISTHDIADLAEEADHVTVLTDGKIVHTGTTSSFLDHASDDVAEGRRAEAAYTALVGVDS